MLLLGEMLHEMSPPLQAMLDTLILVTLSTPIIYLWVIKPYVIARDVAVSKVTYMAFHDPLTQLANRHLLTEYLQKILSRLQRYRHYGALLLIDLDNFKHVNDSYGHSVGDKVLQAVARILTNSIRSVDFLARYGGEEFVLILPELGLNDAKMAAVKICKAVQANILKVDGHTIRVTISGGISLVRTDDTAESLFERADTALYLAKERGRNRCETE